MPKTHIKRARIDFKLLSSWWPILFHNACPSPFLAASVLVKIIVISHFLFHNIDMKTDRIDDHVCYFLYIDLKYDPLDLMDLKGMRDLLDQKIRDHVL